MPSDAKNLDSGKIIVYFTSAFKRNLRALAKKYRHIRSDIQPIIEQLKKGQFIGDQVPRTLHTVYKVRVRNCGLQKGKRAGYQLILFANQKRCYPDHHLFQIRTIRHFSQRGSSNHP